MLNRIKRCLPIGYLNYYRYFKQKWSAHPFGDADLPSIFSEIYRTNYWQGEESICGFTSGVEATFRVRQALQQLLSDLRITSILDIPCGDFVWIKELDLSGVLYTGGDIVAEMIAANRRSYATDHLRFEVLDLTSSPLPKADLVICRDCLVHLSFEHIRQAIANIKRSGSTWLLCTSFVKNQFNYDIRDGGWRTLNLQKPPFHFPAPAATLPDDCPLGDGVFADKAICLWNLSDL